MFINEIYCRYTETYFYISTFKFIFNFIKIIFFISCHIFNFNIIFIIFIRNLNFNSRRILVFLAMFNKRIKSFTDQLFHNSIRFSRKIRKPSFNIINNVFIYSFFNILHIFAKLIQFIIIFIISKRKSKIIRSFIIITSSKSIWNTHKWSLDNKAITLFSIRYISHLTTTI